MAANGKDQKQKIGWIGAGRMGTPMAERLIKAGFDLTVWNRTRAKAEPLAKLGKVRGHAGPRLRAGTRPAPGRPRRASPRS